MTLFETTLLKAIIFKGIDAETLMASLQNISIRKQLFQKDASIVLEGDSCENLGIVLSGLIEIQNVFPSGKTTSVARMLPGQTFGEAILFAQESIYPITIQALQNTEIAFIPKDSLLKLMTMHPQILENYLSLLSNRLILLNGRIKALSMDSLRQKIAHFVLQEHKRQKKMCLSITLTRREMAEHMAVQRPSLSRELIRMQDDGLILCEKHTIEILDLDALEDVLFV